MKSKLMIVLLQIFNYLLCGTYSYFIFLELFWRRQHAIPSYRVLHDSYSAYVVFLNIEFLMLCLNAVEYLLIKNKPEYQESRMICIWRSLATLLALMLYMSTKLLRGG